MLDSCNDDISEYLLPWICQLQSWSKWHGKTEPVKIMTLCHHQIIKITSRAAENAAHWYRFGGWGSLQHVSPDFIAVFLSLPERNTLHRAAVAYLIINAHVYSMLPAALHLHISSFCVSGLNALSVCSLCLHSGANLLQCTWKLPIVI